MTAGAAEMTASSGVGSTPTLALNLTGKFRNRLTHREVKVMKVQKLVKRDVDQMVRKINRGLMVRFINADLVNRAGLDVRKSVVLYDADKMFEYALPELPAPELLDRLHDEAGIRYWSKGV